MNENNLINRILPLKNYSFFLEIFIAMLLILLYQEKRKLFPLRVLICITVGSCFYFIPYLTFLNFNYSFLLIVLTCFILGLFIYKGNVFPILFSVIASWGLQHIAWNFLGIIYDLIPDVQTLSDAALIIICCCVFVFFYFIYFLIIKILKIKIENNKKQFFSFLFSFLMLFTTMYLSQSVETWSIPIRLYTSLSAFLALVIQFGYPYLSNLIIKEKELQDEKDNLEKMLDLQAKQQKLSKQATDILNIKFHDMKHQLLLMKTMNDNDRFKISEEIEKSIDVYSNIAKTGNEAMDIVVSQKALLCSSKNIRFTYILSGDILSFMNSTDITSLYGNILDNAIEAVEEEQGEYRLIKLKTYSQNGLILIQEENYCHKDIKFDQNGLPISIKNDQINHGYGSKSIKYIVEKYKGQLSLKQEGNIFNISIVIPIEENKK